MSGDYILIAGNDTAEEIYGWKFALGDTITLHYFDGTETAQKDVTILGILNQQYVLDNKGLEGWFLMPEQAVLNLVSFDSLTSDLLVSTEPEQEDAIGGAIAELVAERSELALGLCPHLCGRADCGAAADCFRFPAQLFEKGACGEITGCGSLTAPLPGARVPPGSPLQRTW